jgi:hypothetical protein
MKSEGSKRDSSTQADRLAHYERSELNARFVLWSMVGLAVGLVLIMVGTYGWYATSSRVREGKSGRITSESKIRELFPQPRLQTAPRVAFTEWRSHQLHELNRYSWVDKESGTVRIPIDLAISIAAERGLPEFKQGQKR